MAHHRIEKKKIRDRDHARGKGETAMSPVQIESEKPVEQKVYGNRGQRHEHRDIAPIERIKCRRENFVRGITGQTDRVKPKSQSGLVGRFRREATMLVDETDDWFGENDQTNRGWNCEQ